MNQYCRYCSNMVCGDANYCTIKKRCYSDKTIKRTNKCKDFVFNPIDALSENENGYQPKPEKLPYRKEIGVEYWETIT